MSSKPVLLIGAGGHAKVLLDILLNESANIVGILEQNPTVANLYGVPIIGTDETVKNFSPTQIVLVNGIGSATGTALRRRIYDKFTAWGYAFRQVIHSKAIISPRAQLGLGVQIMAGAIVNIGSVIGDDTIINTGASIDHDCRIGAHTHIAPGCVLSGGVTVGANSHIGTGTTVIQDVTIGQNVLIGAGSAVIGNIPAGERAMGVPARYRQK